MRETTRANQEQDWLKTNLARIAGLTQGHRDLLELARLILGELTPLASAQYGATCLATDAAGPQSRQQEFTRIATYGFMKGGLTRFAVGEGLAGFRPGARGEGRAAGQAEQRHRGFPGTTTDSRPP